MQHKWSLLLIIVHNKRFRNISKDFLSVNDETPDKVRVQVNHFKRFMILICIHTLDKNVSDSDPDVNISRLISWANRSPWGPLEDSCLHAGSSHSPKTSSQINLRFNSKIIKKHVDMRFNCVFMSDISHLYIPVLSVRCLTPCSVFISLLTAS